MITNIDKQQQLDLLNIARETIIYGCEHQKRPATEEKWLVDTAFQQRVCTFVTLTKADALNKKQLRGCIGAVTPTRVLVDDVICNAYAAAFQDQRFPKVLSHEVKQLHIAISVLSPYTKISFNSEDDLLTQIQTNVDGLLLKSRGLQATFLPSVWEQLPEKENFLQHLKQKAGFSKSYWSDDLDVFRYTVTYFEEGQTL